jgi:predicted ArsR family transcriptional regulator
MNYYENDTTTKRVWLLLLKEGGHWTATELAKELNVEANDWLFRAVHLMAKRGHIRRHEKPCERLSYSVDKTCKVPMYLKVGDLLQAGAEL